MSYFLIHYRVYNYIGTLAGTMNHLFPALFTKSLLILGLEFSVDLCSFRGLVATKLGLRVDRLVQHPENWRERKTYRRSRILFTQFCFSIVRLLLLGRSLLFACQTIGN